LVTPGISRNVGATACSISSCSTVKSPVPAGSVLRIIMLASGSSSPPRLTIGSSASRGREPTWFSALATSMNLDRMSAPTATSSIMMLIPPRTDERISSRPGILRSCSSCGWTISDSSSSGAAARQKFGMLIAGRSRSGVNCTRTRCRAATPRLHRMRNATMVASRVGVTGLEEIHGDASRDVDERGRQHADRGPKRPEGRAKHSESIRSVAQESVQAIENESKKPTLPSAKGLSPAAWPTRLPATRLRPPGTRI